jgi:hypothetical protein
MSRGIRFYTILVLAVAAIFLISSCESSAGPSGGGGIETPRDGQVEIYESGLKAGKPMFVLYTSPT